jgi:predicted nucleic acid-binding protein
MPPPGNQRRDVVCNSGPLIGLAGIGQLELLAKLYSKVLIVERQLKITTDDN